MLGHEFNTRQRPYPCSCSVYCWTSTGGIAFGRMQFNIQGQLLDNAKGLSRDVVQVA